jgi:alpha-tubulin suppressor-like RCC1 family protein
MRSSAEENIASKGVEFCTTPMCHLRLVLLGSVLLTTACGRTRLDTLARTGGSTSTSTGGATGGTKASGGSTGTGGATATGGAPSTGGYTKLEAKAIAVGLSHTCVVLSGGAVQCWGDNQSSQLGDGTTTQSSVPVTVTGITNAVAVAAGQIHTCAMLSGGAVQCWGDNFRGELGDGTSTTKSPVPVTVTGITNAVAVAAGLNHTCAVLRSGTVQCWGDNYWGELGDGTWTNSSLPVAVTGITNAIAASAGWYHTCALLSNGLVSCWGDGSTRTSSAPVPVIGVSNAFAVAAGRTHTCAVLSGGAVQCWGASSLGGDGSSSSSGCCYGPTPVLVPGINSAVAAAASNACTCAVLSDGTAQCWGVNKGGELGNGTTTDSSVPVTVTGIANALTVASDTELVGDNHSCTLLTDGAVQCWGANSFGELGNGTTTDSPVPVTVTGF